MKIDLLPMDDFIDLNELKEIDSPIIFQRGGVPVETGLLSNEIFGMNVASRKQTFAYINLKVHLFHPHVYKALSRVYPSIDRVISGQKYVSIKGGKLVEDIENGSTGIQYLYENWNKIRWERTEDEAAMRKERLDMLTMNPRNKLFLDKYVVIPVFYRDINTTGGGAETDPLNSLYCKMIRVAANINNGDLYDFSYHGSIYTLQKLLVELYDTFKHKLERKNGMIRKYLMGKNVGYCTRSVITNPIYHSNSPDTLETPFDTAGIPLGQACVLVYPFIVRYLKAFFEREFIDVKEIKTLRKIKSDGTGEEIATAKIYKPEIYFDERYIRNLVDTYVSDPESRFDPILVPVLEEGKSKPTMMPVAFTGKRLKPNSTEELSEISNRPMTITDVLFIAASDALKDKHAVITRYPVSDAYGMFITRCRPISTARTERVSINGEVYEYYPYVKIDTPRHRMHIRFIDSIRFSNSYLAGIGGDYDGDQITCKIIWSQDANAECEQIMRAKSFFINPQGKNVRSMSYEVPQTFYDITKNPTSKNKDILPSVAKELAERPGKDYTFDFICDHIAYKKIEGSRFRMYAPDDRLVLPAKTVRNSSPIETTIGRLIFYKVIIESTGLDEFIKYDEINKSLTKSEYEKIEGKISSLLLKDKIDTALFSKFINHRDWLGLQLHGAVTVSFTEKTTKTPEKVKKLREELFKKYDKELNEGNIIVANKIETELINAMVEEIKDDPGYDVYASGARGNVNNHMKNMFLMRGGVNNPNTGKYDIIRSSFTDGLQKEDFTPASNSIVHGAYFKAVGTADSGYLAKQLMSALQGEVIGEDGSDCGTTLTLDIEITSSDSSNFVNRYINDNGKNVLLSPEVIGSYTGKRVKMYSPMYCRNLANGCICEKCAGKQTSKFPGLDSNKLATVLTNLNMKKFHVTNIEFYTLNPKTAFIVNDGSNYLAIKNERLVATKPIDFLVPEFHYENNLIEELGARMRLFGTISVRLGDNKFDTLNIPSWHNYNVYDHSVETIELPGMGTSKCRVFHYDPGYEICEAKVVKDSENAQIYLKQIIYGKIPTTIPYDKVLSLWMMNQHMNSVNFGVSSLIYETVLSCSYRYKKDPTKKYGVMKAKNPSISLYDYEMAGFRRICQLSSTFAGITFEDFDSMTTSAINKSRTNAQESYSPLEQLLKL